MIKLDKITFENLNFELSVEDMNKIELSMNVDPSALYQTNAVEYFRKAMIGENSTRSKMRQVLGIKDRVKLGNTNFDSLIKPGDHEFDPSVSTAVQKTFEVTPLMIGTSIKIDELEISYVSDQLKRGSTDFSDRFAFMNYFYDTLNKTAQKEMEILTWQGATGGSFSAANAYLNSLNGLEFQLANDGDVLTPATASAVTSANVIDKMIEARDNVPAAVKNEPDFTYIVSRNVAEAYFDAINENKASGQYFVEGVSANFQGRPIFLAEGASNDVIVACSWDNLLNIQDLLSDEVGFTVVDFYKTKLDRKIGVRTDFKFKPTYILGNEIYFHKP